MIEVRHLSKYFGKTCAVHDLSFTVKEGEIFVLLGTSGCGKTTTLKMINRLLEPDEGEVWIGGKNIAGQRPELLRRRIGYVMQDTGLFPHYTIRENVAVIPDLLKWDKEKTQVRAESLLKKFNLPADLYFDLYPDQLSGGQQQRAGFARALMADPPVLLMDEPLGSLDAVTRHQIQKEFRQLDELKGKTILLVTHDIPEAIELGNRICLMDQGAVQQTGSAAELLLRPANDFVRQFFAHDQFIYRLKALQIKDILPFLSKPGYPQSGEPVDTDSDILETLEKLAALPSEHHNFTVADEANGLYYPLNVANLLAAFHQKIRTYD